MADIVQGVLYDVQSHLLLRRYVGHAIFPGRSLADRGPIIKFSASAGARMRRYLRRSVADYRIFVTLTYPREFPTDGKNVKDHLRYLCARLQRAAGYPDGWSAFWFLEFQDRGAPHYHLFLTHEIGFRELARAWYEVVGSGDEKHLVAGTRIEWCHSGRYGMCRYASEYASKMSQKTIPENYKNCGRFWGVIGLRKCQSATLFVRSEHIQSKEFVTFRAELKKILQKHRDKIRFLSLSGACSGVVLKSIPIINEIVEFFHQTALNAPQIFVFEAPLLHLD